jgi:adenosine deaminase
VELHVHLDGSFDPSVLLSHLKETGEYSSLLEESVFPWDQSTVNLRSLVQACESEEAFHSLCTCRGKCSLNSVLECFSVFILIVRGDLILIEKLTCDFVERQAQHNLIYSEVRYSPHLLAKGGDIGGTESVDPIPIIDAVTKGVRRGENEYGVRVNQILCCIAWRPDWAKDIIEMAHERRNNTPSAVVGVDIAPGEEHFDKEESPHLHDLHFQAFQRARELRLNITINAGEVGDAAFVRKAVNEYGATRIGHGYHIVKDLECLEEMRRKNIHFELFPTSSVETGGWIHGKERRDWKTHPAISMLRYGLNLGFNSDDPAVFDTSLTWQYRIAVGKMGLTKRCILKTLQCSINSAFIDDEEKAILRSHVAEYLDKIGM